MTNWRAISLSQQPWEQEALHYLQAQIPASSKIYGWSNFEFVADGGSIYEVDALVVGPWGAFLIEIKSRPGVVRGGGNTWSWVHEGHTVSADNPLLLANRKAKALRSVLQRQKAFKSIPCPFLEALVFLSHETNQIHLSGHHAFRVANRQTIQRALTARDCPGLKPWEVPEVRKPQLQAFHQAMEQAGIRPCQSLRQAGDYRMDSLFLDSPTGSYQEWLGQHVQVQAGPRLIRTYSLHRQFNQEDKQILEQAARREYQILSRLDHPGILQVETMTSAECGPALIYRVTGAVRRLDHFLEENQGRLGMSERLDLLRQMAEAVAYAHRKGVVHRSLAPQSVLVLGEEAGRAGGCLRIYNWQVGVLETNTRKSQASPLSRTLHAEQLLEDASTVYLAPELVAGQFREGPELDIFSLGAIAYTLFTGEPPAGSPLDLNEKLRRGGGFLDVRAVLNSVDPTIVDLVQFSANVDRELRDDAEQFLRRLDQVEEALTTPEKAEMADPRRARPNDQLGHGLVVKHLLGSGGISKVLEVEIAPEETRVLKVTSDPDHNPRLRREYETLRQLSHPGIVKVHQWFEFGDIVGFTMDRAGDSTLAQRLRRDGTLSIDYLERFGEQLLQIIDYLDQQGVAHRDIKPENIGIGSVGKGTVRLILFDFSLSQSPPDQLHVGTPPYLDPFLEIRPHRRWDSYAERFAVAMTLHEMVTGKPATFGDGKSLPHLNQAEVNLEPELFPLNLQQGLRAFFAKALHSDYRRRHDHAQEMLQAWKSLFRDVDKPALSVTTGHGETLLPAATDPLAEAKPETQLVLLGLSTRLTNSLDRLGIVTVKDLLRFPLIKIHRQRGVGKKTREEAAQLVHRLRQRFPSNIEQTEMIRQAAAVEETAEVASIDGIVHRIMELDAPRRETRDQELLHGFLGLVGEGSPTGEDWPSQTEYAHRAGVTRARIGQVVTEARERWLKLPVLDSLREAIALVLRAQGAVMTHRELMAAVLNLRGSALEEPGRSRAASLAVRAAVESERGLAKPRFTEFRRRERIFVACDAAYAEYASQLGEVADNLAAEDPLPSVSRGLEALQAVPFPNLGQAEAPPPDRVARLAAVASRTAALSPRLEFYPRHLPAGRALKLAQGNLFAAKELTVASLRQLVLSRYPESEPVPDRPALDVLLAGINFRMEWSEARQAYWVGGASEAVLSSGISSLDRVRTRFERTDQEASSPEESEAQRLQEKLEYALRRGSFLVLAVGARFLARASDELTRRFDLQRIDADRLFLQALRATAGRLGVHWPVVLKADAASPDSRDWERLQALVEQSLPEVRQTIEGAGQTVLLTNPGLFARYRRMALLDTLRHQVGTSAGPPGLWLLLPGGDGQGRPALGQEVIPLVNPAHFEVLNRAWLENRPVRQAPLKV